MVATRPLAGQALGLRPGETVEVRGQDEILATLDERGELDSLPFMPEMLQFCGQRFTVAKRANKLCDTISWSGIRRMEDAVHLAGARCDGGGHGGCQAGCFLYWKEAWLKRVDDGTVPARAPAAARPVATTATLESAAQPAPGRYACQATELLRAAPTPIPSWDPRQYVEDVTSGNVSALAAVRSVAVGAFNEYQDASRRLPPWLRIKGGERFPFIRGTLTRTPDERLGLQPGDVVRVKSREEILATLDTHNKNRGMSFDGEMLRYCGREARVLRRVEQIIDEATGEMLKFGNPCIVLEDVVCVGAFHRVCPRSIYPYWREIWLEKVR